MNKTIVLVLTGALLAAPAVAQRPVEPHAHEKGDHGFGLGIPGTTTILMVDQFKVWLESRGLLGRAPAPSHATPD